MSRSHLTASKFKARVWVRGEHQMFPCAAVGSVRYLDYPDSGFYAIDENELYAYPDPRPDLIYSEITIPLVVDSKQWTDEERDRFAEADVMWWTGHYDKDGREIYDGDIVRLRSSLGRSQMWLQGVVRWISGCPCIEVATAQSPGAPIHYYAHDWLDQDIEVLGNIYEDPELLELWS